MFASMNALLFLALGFSGLRSALTYIRIPLDKQYVPVLRKGRAVMHKTAYFGQISLGHPYMQNFTVLFDTGSAHTFVPSSECKSEVCSFKHSYDRSSSTSALDVAQNGNKLLVDSEIDQDEVQISFGTGDIAGNSVRETVCLSFDVAVPVCAETRVILATSMTTDPFSEFEFDGVLGLGLETLAIRPEFSFFSQAIAQNPNMHAQFAIYLSKHDDTPSEIVFGGYDTQRFSGTLQWAEVIYPEAGYWMLPVESVRIGNETLELCEPGDCLAITDTGTSLLGVPKQASQHINFMLARTLPDTSEDVDVDCRQEVGPELVINVGGVELTLGPEDYSRPAGMRLVDQETDEAQFVCRAQILPVDHSVTLGPKAWILGEPVLRKYYSVFDWSSKRVGFAPAVPVGPPPTTVQADAVRKAEPSSHRVVGAVTRESLKPTVVLV